MSKDSIKSVLPSEVLHEIAEAVPEGCRDKLIVIGSLAVGYHYRDKLNGMAVRTKDADCLLSPRVAAIDAGVKIADELMDAGWEYWKTSEHTQPGTASTPDRDLPAVRLTPPETTEWFIELLTVPANPDDHDQRWSRLETRHGHFGICSFGFISLTDLDPIDTEFGIRIARPEMMALANLLEHPEIRPDTMTAGFAGRMDIKRSNKDLGRVLAIGRLAMMQDEDALLDWPSTWKDALERRFPNECQELASRVGKGLRELMASEPDFEQALHTCANGLLASRPPSLAQLRIVGLRMEQDAISPLESEIPRARCRI